MRGTIYILRSKDSGRYYIGSTTNLNRRLNQHQAGHTHTTTRYGKLELVFYQVVASIKLARQAEKRIKSWKRRDYIDRIIAEGKISFLE